MKNTKAILSIATIKILRFLPFHFAQRVGKWLGRCASLLPTESRRVTAINLKLCFPELSGTEHKALTRESLEESGKLLMEIPHFWERPIDFSLGKIEKIEGEELLKNALRSNKGLLLLAPHLGNWELIGLFFSSRYAMAAMYSPPNVPGFEAYMIDVRSKAGSELVPTSRKGLARMITLLREGDVVGILPDQSSRGPGSTYAPFFGIEVRTMTLATKLLQKSNATVLSTYARRESNGRFTIVIKEVNPDIRSTDLFLACKTLNETVEECVRDCPAQYQWAYKRFKHRPSGLPHPYKAGRTCR